MRNSTRNALNFTATCYCHSYNNIDTAKAFQSMRSSFTLLVVCVSRTIRSDASWLLRLLNLWLLIAGFFGEFKRLKKKARDSGPVHASLDNKRSVLRGVGCRLVN